MVFLSIFRPQYIQKLENRGVEIPIPSGKEAQAIHYYMFGDWVLSNFKNIEEVKQALTSFMWFHK